MTATAKTRGRQARPTRTEVIDHYERLRAAADLGNVQASALLIALAENKPLAPVLERASA
jgi:hypothetical protein